MTKHKRYQEERCQREPNRDPATTTFRLDQNPPSSYPGRVAVDRRRSHSGGARPQTRRQRAGTRGRGSRGPRLFRAGRTGLRPAFRRVPATNNVNRNKIVHCEVTSTPTTRTTGAGAGGTNAHAQRNAIRETVSRERLTDDARGGMSRRERRDPPCRYGETSRHYTTDSRTPR